MIKDELKNLIIYTGVYYTDDNLYRIRSQIWFKTFDNAARMGIRVVVRNDGGLPPEMLERIKTYSNITIVDKISPSTLGGGRREALQKAIEIAGQEGIEHPVFLWTEPEKDDLVTEKNLLPMIAEVRAGSNIVMPERGEKAWEQLPRFQRFLEKRANKSANKNLPDKVRSGAELDLWFGAKVFDKIGAQYFLGYNSDRARLDLWDAITVPVVDAINDGKKVTSLPIDFSYNEIQIENESDESQKEIKMKRLEQYAKILKELGDPKWVEFFEEAKNELEEIKKINRENLENKTELLKESRQSLTQKFFKLK